MTTLQLDGESLTIGDVRRVAAEGARVEIASCAIGKMAASRALVERLAAPDLHRSPLSVATGTAGGATGFAPGTAGAASPTPIADRSPSST